MVLSQKSHGQKSDKETQSPLLKIFKDMVQKEKVDPEKTNLLKNKHADKKRKHYSGTRTKSARKSIESSSSEHQKRMYPYEAEQELRNVEVDACRSQIRPFSSEKRESWWFWGDTEDKAAKQPGEDDTHSCVSCALKKLISADYACFMCLIVLFIISVVIAIMLVYRSVPCMTGGATVKEAHVVNAHAKTDVDRLKRRSSEDGSWNFGIKNSWANVFTRSYEPAFGSFNFQDMTSLVESEGDLSRIFIGDRMNDIEGSDRLKEFYRKLIQTDAAIRNLKKGMSENVYVNSDKFLNPIDFNSNTDRIKRSLNLFHQPVKPKTKTPITKSKIDNGKVVSKTTINMTSKNNNKSGRNRRCEHFNGTESFVIEKNKVVIKYSPFRKRIVAKCSHAPKDVKSHETQLNHPFYKNTQRLDELLDKFLDRKLPDLLSDQIEIDNVVNKDNKLPYNEVENTTDDDSKLSKEGHAEEKILVKVDEKKNNDEDNIENDFFDDSDGVDKKTERSPSTSYDILLSISTLINPTVKRNTSYQLEDELVDRIPNLRKLMQVDPKEDEGWAYEDQKELLVGDKASKEDSDNDEGEREKRDDASYTSTANTEMKQYPVGVQNPNWKGAMPLYPDELNQILKTSPYPDNKYQFPVHNTNLAPDTAQSELIQGDVEYVEDYLNGGYEKLVQLAQAYSDYGVINQKKDADDERKAEDKIEQLGDRKARLSLDGLKTGLKRGLRKSGLLDKVNKGSDPSEGIRIEMHPENSTALDDDESDLYKIIQKHVKIVNVHKPVKQKCEPSLPKSRAYLHMHSFNLPLSKLGDVEKLERTRNNDPVFKIRVSKRDDEEKRTRGVEKSIENFGNTDPMYETDKMDVHKSRALLSLEVTAPDDSSKPDDDSEMLYKAASNTDLTVKNETNPVHSSNKSDANNKNKWFHSKVRNIVNSYTSDPKTTHAQNNFRNKRNVLEKKLYLQDDYKRNARNAEYEQIANNRNNIDFVALAAKMKDICKRTAHAVQTTKNSSVKDDTKGGHVATSLMQQLVRMMMDLVDYQVKERTCRKLPPDLQKFLEWLTASDSKYDDTDTLNTYTEAYSSEKKDTEVFGAFDEDTGTDFLQSSERNGVVTDRTDCLGTLHDVEDLIKLYEDMSDDDKSVMTGVRDYLENQKNYLQRQLSYINDYNFYNKYGSRFRRDVITDVGNTVADVIDVTARGMEYGYEKLQDVYRKCMRKFKHASRKVAKTTASLKKVTTSVGREIGKIIKAHKRKRVKNLKLKEKAATECAKVLGRNGDVKNKDKESTKDTAVHIKEKDHVKVKDSLKDKQSHTNEHAKDVQKEHKKVKDHQKNIEIEDDLGSHGKIKDEPTLFRIKTGRNIKDVYFKAVEEAKKMTTAKTHKRESDQFDKTEIFRIND